MITKIITIGVMASLMVGCSSTPKTSKFSVTEPTDYAMSCESLLNEIGAIKAKLHNDDSLVEKFVPDYLLNKENLTENDMLVLSERRKSLQLIYTLKENKNECRTLTLEDTKEKSKIGKTADSVKETVKEVSN
jgi:hypothetical protein